MFDNEHFIRSRSFSGWTHTLLVSRATASPLEVPPLSGPAIQWTISSAQAHPAGLDRCRAPRPARPLAAPGRIAPTGPPAARLESAQFFTISTAKRPPLGVWSWLNPIGCFGIAEGADRGRRLRRATGVCKPSAGERHVSQQRVASEANMKGDLAHLDATENRRSEERAILSHTSFSRGICAGAGAPCAGPRTAGDKRW